VFGLFGFSDANPNPVAWIATVGVGGTSLLPGRSRDTFGVGYYFAGVSNMLINSLEPVSPVGDEEGVELFYNVEVAKWFRVTPDLQILNPTRQDAETAVVAGLRAQLVF
jgi:porin